MELIKKEKYAAAVVTLVTQARGSGSGARAAAQVVLNAYNGHAWQLDLIDLCFLDTKHYLAAIDVIRGRVELGIEPHTLIKSGVEIFAGLSEQWKRYSIANRWKSTCVKCAGSGQAYVNDQDPDDYTRITCPRCEGEGLLTD